MHPTRTLADGEEIVVESDGQVWHLSWHPPTRQPVGSSQGASGVCITPDGGIVLVGTDGLQWDLPGGRPEGDETPEQTLRREMLEEACAIVERATLIGFCRGICSAGPEAGRCLVRSFWRADVSLGPWEPRFEISHRLVVPATEALTHLIPHFVPIFRRALHEAGCFP